MNIFLIENTDHVNSPRTQRILQSEPKTWQESLYKNYLRVNRLYKHIIYYAWRFSEIHIYKLILFLMVLISVLKVKIFFVVEIIMLILLSRYVHLMWY